MHNSLGLILSYPQNLFLYYTEAVISFRAPFQHQKSYQITEL